MTTELVLLPLGVVAGALTQRVTGIGFALVCAPLLVLVAGPFDGVVLANLLGLIVSLVVFVAHWRDTEWRRGLLLAVPALVAIPLGAWVARTVAPAPLMVVIGSLVIVALGAVVLSTRARVLKGTRGAVVAGGASGFMNVTAGVGGPAIVLYAVSTDWEHRKFVATFQFYSIFTNVASLVAKGGLPHIGTTALLVSLGALAVGLLGGEVLSRHVDHAAARRLAIGLALTGACFTVVKGVLSW
ncbi:sulfite exporter TauE/SafE family protein [Terrabacter aeriphilus]|uniref:Probable membrane transporter protein n=1 Tax=Terrabacter aeriphilus TaxID=515662 RepID=A0ABP9JGK5_9MICO